MNKSTTKKSTKIAIRTVAIVLMCLLVALTSVGIYFATRKKEPITPEVIVDPLEFATDKWDGETVDNSEFLSGDKLGNRGDHTYTINSASSFVYFIGLVNDEDRAKEYNYFKDYTIYLNSNIDLSGYSIQSIGKKVTNDQDETISTFQGTFNGAYYSIMNADIVGNGLFGYVENANIQNVGLYNATINSTSDYTGSIVGEAVNTNISNVYARLGSVQGSTVGGITGSFISNNGTHTISNSFVDNTLIGDKVGAIAGNVDTKTTSANAVTISYVYYTQQLDAINSFAFEGTAEENYVTLNNIINTNVSTDFSSWNYSSSYSIDADWCNYAYRENSTQLSFNFPIQTGFAKVFLNGSYIEGTITMNGTTTDATTLSQAFSSVEANQEAEINLIVEKIFMDEEAVAKANTTLTITPDVNTTLVRSNSNSENLIVGSSNSKLYIGEETAPTNSSTITIDGNIDYVKSNNIQSGSLIYAQGDDLIIGSNVTLQNNINNTTGYGGAITVYGINQQVGEDEYLPVAINANISNCEATTGGGVCVIDSIASFEGGTISNCHATSNGGNVAIISASDQSDTQTLISTYIKYGGNTVTSLREVVSSTNYAFNNETISGGSAANGGNIYASNPGADLYINYSTISAGTARYYGGGVYYYSSTSRAISIQYSKINNNVSEYSAGGLYLAGGNTSSMLDVTFRDDYNNSRGIISNEAAINGGGLYAGYCEILFRTDFKVKGNELTSGTSSNGAGIYANNCIITNNANTTPYGILDMSHNTGAGNGGAMYIYGGSANFERSGLSMYVNSANNGGALYIAGGADFTCSDGGMSLHDNSATNEGAEIYIAGHTNNTTLTFEGFGTSDVTSFITSIGLNFETHREIYMSASSSAPATCTLNYQDRSQTYGLTFLGYNNYSFATTASWTSASQSQVTSNTTGDVRIWYAIFRGKNYTVTFDPNGGSVSQTSKTVRYSQDYGTLPTPTREGYTFDGWYTSATGGTLITSTSTVNTGSNHTLYAHWTATVRTITYNANGGSLYGDTASYVTSNSVTLDIGEALGTLPTPLRIGYTFDGWFTSQTGGTQVTSSYVPSSNMTLYAHWTSGGNLSLTTSYDGETLETYTALSSYQLIDPGEIDRTDAYKHNGWTVSDGVEIYTDVIYSQNGGVNGGELSDYPSTYKTTVSSVSTNFSWYNGLTILFTGYLDSDSQCIFLTIANSSGTTVLQGVNIGNGRVGFRGTGITQCTLDIDISVRTTIALVLADNSSSSTSNLWYIYVNGQLVRTVEGNSSRFPLNTANAGLSDYTITLSNNDGAGEWHNLFVIPYTTDVTLLDENYANKQTSGNFLALVKGPSSETLTATGTSIRSLAYYSSSMGSSIGLGTQYDSFELNLSFLNSNYVKWGGYDFDRVEIYVTSGSYSKKYVIAIEEKTINNFTIMIPAIDPPVIYFADFNNSTEGYDIEYHIYTGNGNSTTYRSNNYIVVSYDFGEGSGYPLAVATWTGRTYLDRTPSVTCPEGTIFGGWYDNPEFTGDPITDETIITKEYFHTLYAKYIDNYISFESQTLASGTVNSAYNQSFNAATGTGTISYAVSNVTLDGETVTASNGVYNGLSLNGTTISGTPTKGGTYVFTIVASNDQDLSISATITLTINKINNPVSVVGNTLVYNMTAQNLCSVTGSETTVYYSTTTQLTSSNYLTAGSTTIPTGTNAGDYTVYWYTPATDVYNSASGSIGVTIAKANVVVNGFTNLVYNGEEQELLEYHGYSTGVVGDLQGLVYFAVGTELTSSNYSTDGSTTIPTRKDAEVGLVYYYVPTNTNYNSTSGNVSFRLLPYTVAFEDYSVVWNGSNEFEFEFITGIKDETLTLIFTTYSSDVGLYTMSSGDTASEGEYILNIETDYNVNNYYSETVPTIEITRATISIPTANTGLIYDGREKTGVNEGDYYTLSGHKQTNAGEYTAVASVDDNHIWSNGSTDDQLIDWSIAKAQVSVPTAVEGLVYNGEEQTGVIGGDYFELTNNTGTNAGNYTAIATLDDKNNYEWSDGTTEDKEIAWSIAKADGSFTFNGSTITYDATNHTLTATDVVGGTIEYSTEENGTYSSVPPTFKNVGRHTIYARLVGDDNHNDASSKSATLVINPYELTIDAYTTAWTGASSYNRVVNGVGGESVTLTYTPSNTNAGTFTYQSGSNSFTLSLNSNNYEVGTAGNLILESVEIEFTVNGYTGVYDGDPHGITINVTTPSTGYTITYSETLSGSYSETPITRTDAGETTVYFKINATNYTEATGSATIVISRAPIDAPTARTDLVYNGTLQTGVEANDEYYTITNNTGTNANQYTATLTLKSNYAWRDNSTDTLQISWSIAKYGLNVGDYEVDWVSSASSYTRTVDGVNNEDVTLSYIPHSNSVGDYTYSTTAGADLYLINIENTNNYEITSAGTFTISPIGIVYNAEGYTGTYDEEGHSITVTVTTPASGYTIYYSENESSGYTKANISKTDAGTYTIYFKIEADNYETATGSATIQINRKEIAIPKANTGLVYAGTSKVGLSEGTGYTRSGDYQATNAGTYTAIASLDNNHKWSDGNVEDKEIPWSIAKKGLTVTADDKSMNYGDNAPSYTFSASGFVNNETNSVLSGSAVYTIKDDTNTISNVSTADAGTYTIEISGLTSNNYEISFVSGTLTINKRNISACDIELSQYSYNFDATEHKPTVSLSIDGMAVDESNYEVTYSDNVYPGTATVTVTATEDSNLTGSDTVNFTIIAVSYNIIYDTNGGNTIANGTYTIKTNEQTTITLTTPTRSGYSFAGYTIVTNSQNRDSTISGEHLTILTIPAKAYGDITVEAHWKVKITIEVVGNKTGNTFEIIGGSNTITTSGHLSVPEGSELTFNTTLIADDSSSSYQLFSIYIDDELVRTVSSKNNENDHYQLSSDRAINKACTVKLEFKDANELTIITEEEYAIDTNINIDGVSEKNIYATDSEINISITLDTSSIATGPNAYIGFTYVMNGETHSLSYNSGDNNIKQDLDGTSGDVYAYTFTGDKGITEIHVLVREVVNVNINTTNQSVTALSLTSVDNFTRQIAINESDNYQLYVGEWKIEITTSGDADKETVIKNIFGEGKYRYDTETKTYYYIVESQQSST